MPTCLQRRNLESCAWQFFFFLVFIACYFDEISARRCWTERCVDGVLRLISVCLFDFRCSCFGRRRHRGRRRGHRHHLHWIIFPAFGNHDIEHDLPQSHFSARPAPLGSQAALPDVLQNIFHQIVVFSSFLLTILNSAVISWSALTIQKLWEAINISRHHVQMPEMSHDVRLNKSKQ